MLPPKDRLKGKKTRAEVIKIYSEYGWKKTLEFPWIEVDGRTREIFKKIYRFTADTLQCSSRRCSAHQLTFVTLYPTGVCWTCAICRRSMGELTWGDGALLNGPRGESVTPEKAWEIVNATNQYPPIGLEPLGAGDLQIVG